MRTLTINIPFFKKRSRPIPIENFENNLTIVGQSLIPNCFTVILNSKNHQHKVHFPLFFRLRNEMHQMNIGDFDSFQIEKSTFLHLNYNLKAIIK